MPPLDVVLAQLWHALCGIVCFSQSFPFHMHIQLSCDHCKMHECTQSLPHSSLFHSLQHVRLCDLVADRKAANVFVVVQAQRSAFLIGGDVIESHAVFNGWFDDAVPQSLYRKPGTFSPSILAPLGVHHVQHGKWESGVSLLMLSLSYGFEDSCGAWVDTCNFLQLGRRRSSQDADHLHSMHQAAVLMALCISSTGKQT